jgi:hypothetical protein
LVPGKIGLSFDDKKSPSGIPERNFVSWGLCLSTMSIAIISAVGLPVTLGGAIVARVETLRYSALGVGAEVPVIVLPDVIARASILVVTIVA